MYLNKSQYGSFCVIYIIIEMRNIFYVGYVQFLFKYKVRPCNLIHNYLYSFLKEKYESLVNGTQLIESRSI